MSENPYLDDVYFCSIEDKQKRRYVVRRHVLRAVVRTPELDHILIEDTEAGRKVAAEIVRACEAIDEMRAKLEREASLAADELAKAADDAKDREGT